MADTNRRRRVKSEDDSEGSLSDFEAEGEGSNAENSTLETPEKLVRRRRRFASTDDSDDLVYSDAESNQEDEEHYIRKCRMDLLSKVLEGAEYEIAQEEKDVNNRIVPDESELKENETLSEIVDEEGGEEGIAESEDVDGDFLDPNDEDDDASDEDEDDDEEDEEYVEEERQQGDGEECSPPNPANEKELDFDEDRRNPQYIPKKGIFYEHDDRNNEDLKEKEEEPPRDRKKKLWLDEGQWGHDRFREVEQYPKSRHELIEAYGYDIRNEDGPPRARRRRRYGRGPTKYDRNWEDVTAYGRERFRGSPRGFSRGPRAPRGIRGGPRFRGRGRRENNSPSRREEAETPPVDEVPDNTECEETKPIDTSPIINNSDFPALPNKEENIKTETPTAPEEESYSNSNNNNNNSSNNNTTTTNGTESKSVRTLTFENSNYSNRNSVERDIPPRRGKPYMGNHDRGNRRGGYPRSNRGGGRGDYRGRGRPNPRHISPRFLENKMNNLSVDMEQLTMEASENCIDVNPDVSHVNNDGVLSCNPNVTEISNMTLKGAGDSSGRPKRYSSLRQRSLPETNTYQTAPPPTVPPPHPSYYETGYQPTLYAPQDTCVPTPSTQSQTVTSTPILNPSAYQTFTPPPYTDSYGIRMPVTTPPPRLFPQVSVPTPQPLLPPPPCIAAPPPTIMNFAGPPPPPAGYHQFAAYQQYAAPQPPPPPVPAPANDLYQSPAGITYYYPPSQPPPVRPTVQKRPKAAIPILPPPERETKRNDKDSSRPSNPVNNSNTNFSEPPSESADVEVSIRTETSTPLQPTVGVES